MPQWLFELLCVVIVVVTLALRLRQAPNRGFLLAEYAALAVAGSLSEQLAIQWYRYYWYADVWSVHVGALPLLVPLIWPLVILSAGEVVDALWPHLGRLRPLALGAVVVFDASLVEAVAVRAGLWSWSEGGHLNVPLMGMLGWGYFALAAALGHKLRPAWRLGFLLVAAPALTHVMILASWWGLFRWTLRGPLGLLSFALLGIGAAAFWAAVIKSRRANRCMNAAVAGPRIVAALLFFALLVTTAPFDVPLWVHVVIVSVPYIAATGRASVPQVATPAA